MRIWTRAGGSELCWRLTRTLESVIVSSSEEGVSGGRNDRVVRQRISVDDGGLKVILKFKKGQNDIRKVSLVALSRGLHELLGDILFVRVLNDGALLIKCKTEGQREKALKLNKVCNKMVENIKKVGEGQGSFVRGVIYGIPVEDE